MTRLVRKSIVQFMMEDDGYGTGIPAGSSWGPTDAIQVANPSFRIIRNTVPRDLVRGYFGASEELPAYRQTEIKFDVELAPSGTAGVAPKWGLLLRAAGFAETVTVDTKVVYTPITDDPESGVVRYWLDGVGYYSRGARATAELMLDAFGIPKARFTISGFDNAANSVSASASFTGWADPEVITTANSSEIKLGATLAAAGSMSGGTAYPHRGLSIDIGNQLEFSEVVGDESIDITDRQIVGKTTMSLTAAQEVTWRTEINAVTLSSFGLRHGSGAGKNLTVFGPAVQRVDPQTVDHQGRALTEMELRFKPSSGNDDLSIVCW